MSIVLVCIVVMFILCQSIKIIPDVFEAITCDHGTNKNEVSKSYFFTRSCGDMLTALKKCYAVVRLNVNWFVFQLKGVNIHVSRIKW